MRLIKLVAIFCLILTLGAIFYFVQRMDIDEVDISLEDRLRVSELGDSLSRKELVDTSHLTSSPLLAALFQDYEARVVDDSLVVLKGYRSIFKVKINKSDLRQILLSDLNENDAPECWVLLVDSNAKSSIKSFEFNSGHTNRINFPNLMGSQAFGYAGSDSIYLDKTGIVRQFKFENDPYADLTSGKRACFYQFGKDQSFVLKKTIDLE